MNVDQLHQLQMGSFEDRTWNWIIGGLKDIYGQEKGLDLIDEKFSIIICFSDIQQCRDSVTQVKQRTSGEYMDMMKIWLAALAPHLKGHPNHFKPLKSVTYIIFSTSYR
jgi:hypothetical protein